MAEVDPATEVATEQAFEVIDRSLQAISRVPTLRKIELRVAVGKI